jgi:hypothetical protein
MSSLIHTIYASRAVNDFSTDEIVNLLSKARKKNASLGVTGMLLYDDDTFFQVLEGQDKVLDQLFSEISADKRHHQVTKIISEAISKRQFSDWSMGYAAISSDELRTIEGMNDFFTKQNCLAKIDAGRAKKLLKAFALGRWRLD